MARLVRFLLASGAAAFDPLPAEEQQACLAAWNKYRAMAGLEPLILCPTFAQEWANYEAKYDAGIGTFHSYCTSNGGWESCYKSNCGEKLSKCGAYPNWKNTPGQCEYWEPIWGNNAGVVPWETAVKVMFAEGPGGGHYDTIVSPTAGCVACGYMNTSAKHWVTFNTCCKDDGPTPVPVPTPSPSPTPTPGSCVDVNADCEYQVQQGHCNEGGEYYEWMTRNCPRACGFCTQCEDLNDECTYHVSQGLCTSGNKWYDWMTQYCAKACGFCKGTEADVAV